MREPTCRNCGAALQTTFADLGVSPLANSYVTLERAGEMEPHYPLHARVCDRCYLVQVEAFESPDQIFSNYAYFSSYSDLWLEHCRSYAGATVNRLKLAPGDLVAEAASNDGYLLQYFRDAGMRVLGVEPAANVAAVARTQGIATEVAFLGRESGQRIAVAHGRARLVVANNVIAHVPDLHDFVEGLKALMAPGATLTIEFPHIANLIAGVQFDTIYHEHFSYYSLHSMEDLLGRHELRVIDVERLPTHGGSLRLWVADATDVGRVEGSVELLRADERALGIASPSLYTSFEAKVALRKRELLRFLIEAADRGKRVAAYGAPAKGNTLLNYCGIKSDMISFTVDRNPVKQNTLLPGSRIPVFAPERYRSERPDYVLVLPWNIRDEIVEQMGFIREWGGRFVVDSPALEIF